MALTVYLAALTMDSFGDYVTEKALSTCGCWQQLTDPKSHLKLSVSAGLEWLSRKFCMDEMAQNNLPSLLFCVTVL